MIKKDAVIFDLDGTIACIDQRRQYLEGKKDWDAFFSEIHNDTLNEWSLELINLLRTKYKIIIVSGRSKKYEAQTKDWLTKYSVYYDTLIKRELNDLRKDCEVKKDLFISQIQDKFKILFVVDDRASVVSMWRELGLVCLDCANYKF